MSVVNEANKIEVVEVRIPPAKENLGRTIGSIAGLVLAALGVLMMLSIILILPGIGAVLIGLVVAVMTVPKANVDCPACGTENKVTLKSKRLKCEGCETVTPLKWNK